MSQGYSRKPSMEDSVDADVLMPRDRRAGDAVAIQGLKGRAELNGRVGEVVQYDATSGRFVVSIDSGREKIKIKDENLAAGAKLPVTLVTGLPGAGKTTLAEHVVNGPLAALRVARLANTLAHGVTASAASSSSSAPPPPCAGQPAYVEGGVSWLRGGCICCTRCVDMVVEVMRLSKPGGLDYLLVEASPSVDPRAVANLFRPTEANGSRMRRASKRGLADYAELDTVVCVVDAGTLFARIRDGTPPAQLLGAEMELQNCQSVAQLLVSQVEFADMIILNKSDMLSRAELHEASMLLKALNPEAGVIESTYGKVPEYEILGRGAYMWHELQVKQPTRKWMEQAHDRDEAERESSSFTGAFSSCTSSCCDPQALSTAVGAVSATAAVSGISAFLFEPTRPFHPTRLAALATGDGSILPSEVLRIHGTLWLASQVLRRGRWSTVGSVTQITAGPVWWSAIPMPEWPAYAKKELVDHDFWSEQAGWRDCENGDRHSELLVIGKDMIRTEIEDVLDSLLVSLEELKAGPAAWVTYEDGLFAWERPRDLDDGMLLYSLTSIGQEGNVRALCAIRADPNARNPVNNGSALHAAALKGRVRTIRALLEHRADANIAAQRGLAPLHLANSGEVATLLCEHRANPDLADTNGHTPLHHAAALARADVLSALVASGATVDALTKAAESPLHIAAMSQDVDASSVVRALCEAKADLQLVSGSAGLDALGIAKQAGKAGLMRLLTGELERRQTV